MEKEFLVPFHAGDRRIDDLDGVATSFADASDDTVDGELMGCRVADDAPFADVFAAGFELRLDQQDCLGERGRGGKNGGKNEGCRDKRDIHDEGE